MTRMMPDTNSNPVIAVDIGSTRTHAGLIDTTRLRCLFRKDILSTEVSGRLAHTLDEIIARAASGKPLPAVIAGGGKGLAGDAETILKNFGAGPVSRLVWRDALPVKFLYENKRNLGADRIADALYAVARYPGRSVVIIDSGTCITVDAITASGKFLGGVIMPGAAAQLRSMSAAAAMLPAVELPDGTPPLPGAATAECMQAGAMHGIAGALIHLVKKYRAILGGKCVILATGGGWEGMKDLVNFRAAWVPDMTLIGTALFR